MYWRQAPGFYKTLDEADAFLNDVMPYSTETITRTAATLPDKSKTVTYTSPMTDGRQSVIIPLQTPQKAFFVAYREADPQ